MKDDSSKLIPELADWNDGAGISLESWIGGIGRFDHALGYAAIFWPNFVQYERCIFHLSPDDSVYRDWMKIMAGDCAKVEAMMNHVHLFDLFVGLDYQPSKALLVRLGQIMQEMWRCKLSQDFPGKRFEVCFESDTENLKDLVLTFYQLP